jgi:hypothetical protein
VIDALLQGKLLSAPTTRTAKNGKPFALARMRVSAADGAYHFVSVIAFEAFAVASLMALTNNDSVAIAGELSIKTYQDKNGETKVGLDLTAHAIISQYDVQRKRRAIAEGKTP